MSKLSQIKTAIKNTPPDRLAKIEYQSHLLQMIGVTIVCGIFIYQGYWWIILAFVFSLGISLSQGIAAYQRHVSIKEFVGDTYDYKKDKSPSRRRDHVIKSTLGITPKFVALLVSFIICIFNIPYHTWYFKILLATCFLSLYILIYFFPIYWYAKVLFDQLEGRK